MAKQVKASGKRRSGTHYVKPDEGQVNFKTDPALKKAFYASCVGTHIRDALSATMIVWMALEDYSSIRGKAIRVAQQMTPKAAAAEIRLLMENMMADRIIERAVSKMSEPEKAKFLVMSRKSREEP